MNDIKRRLRNYKFLKAKKTELEFRIQELSYNIGPAGLSYEDKGGHTNKISRTVEENAIKITETEEKLKKLITEKGIEIDRIENSIRMELVKENADRNVLKELISRKKEQEALRDYLRIVRDLDIINVLTPEQKAQFNSRMR